MRKYIAAVIVLIGCETPRSLAKSYDIESGHLKMCFRGARNTFQALRCREESNARCVAQGLERACGFDYTDTYFYGPVPGVWSYGFQR